MKILMLCDSFGIGGAETHLLELCLGLKRRGHAVTLASGGGVYLPKLTCEGVRHIRIPIAKKGLLSLWKSWRILSHLLTKEQFDICHAHTRKTAFLCRFLSKKHGVPTVTTAHWTFSLSFPLRRLSYWGARTLAVSRDIREYLIREYGLYPDNVHVTVNGISEERFTPREATSRGGERKFFAKIPQNHDFSENMNNNSPQIDRIITVSRLDNGRALTAELLISVMPRLRKRYPHVTLTVVGDGSEFPRLRALAEEKNREIRENEGISGRNGGVFGENASPSSPKGEPWGEKRCDRKENAAFSGESEEGSGRNGGVFGETACISMVGGVTEVAPLLHEHQIFVGASRAALEGLLSGCLTLLSGDEGYLSLFTPENAERASYTNFCFRGESRPDEDKLFFDLCRLLDMDAQAAAELCDFGRQYVRTHYSVARMCEDAEAAYSALAVRSESSAASLPNGFFSFKKQENREKHAEIQEKDDNLALKRTKERKRRIFLLGYYGRNNLGDEATLRALTALLKREARHICAVGKHPRRLRRREEIDAISYRNPFFLFFCLLFSDACVLGGGTVLQERSSRRSLWYYLTISRLAHMLRKPIYVVGGGIGEIRASSRRKIAAVFRDARCFWRTPQDLSAAMALGLPQEHTFLLPDPVFSLSTAYGRKADFDTQELAFFRKTADFLKKGGERHEKNAAEGGAFLPEHSPISPRASDRHRSADLPPQAAAEEAHSSGRLRVLLAVREAEYLSALSEELAAADRSRFEFRFAVLAPEDEAAAVRLAAVTGGSATALLTPLALAEELRWAEVAIGNRLHLLIFALRFGVTPIALPYDEKVVHFADFVNSTLQILGYSEGRMEVKGDEALTALLEKRLPRRVLLAVNEVFSSFYHSTS